MARGGSSWSTASCSGVRPSLLRALGLALCASSRNTIWMCLALQAWCSGVASWASTVPTSACAFKRYSTMSTSS